MEYSLKRLTLVMTWAF